MTWQKVTDHINDSRIHVQSRSGSVYPVETEYESDNSLVYKWAMGDLAPDVLWADVTFEGDTPTTDRISTGDPNGGPPDRE